MASLAGDYFIGPPFISKSFIGPPLISKSSVALLQRHFVHWYVFHWQTSEACPVNVPPLAWVAVMVTGFASAAVQVAVTCPDGDGDRWTDGSLAVQLETTSAAVAMPMQPFWLLNLTVALKVWLLAGAAAAWLTVADAGPTTIPVTPQSGAPPQLMVSGSAKLKQTPARSLLRKLFAKNLDANDVNIWLTP
ncbi:MAG TPA: hypothetical protein VJW55_13885 [Candidatus Angelobacter sp.]|nr:hypothetical protein [Candidatus Angelobacter sp.]